MVTMLSSCMDSISTEPPETTFQVMVCCLPLGSLVSHWPASAFRLSNDALEFGADRTGTEIAKTRIARAAALSFIEILPRLAARRSGDKSETAGEISSAASLPDLYTVFWGPFRLSSKLSRARLPNILVKILQVLTHGHHELVSIRAIDNAVTVTHGETDDVPHGN